MMSLGSKIEFSLFGMADDGGNDADIPTVTRENYPVERDRKTLQNTYALFVSFPLLDIILGSLDTGKPSVQW